MQIEYVEWIDTRLLLSWSPTVSVSGLRDMSLYPCVPVRTNGLLRTPWTLAYDNMFVVCPLCLPGTPTETRCSLTPMLPKRCGASTWPSPGAFWSCCCTTASCIQPRATCSPAPPPPAAPSCSGASPCRRPPRPLPRPHRPTWPGRRQRRTWPRPVFPSSRWGQRLPPPSLRARSLRLTCPGSVTRRGTLTTWTGVWGGP